VFSSSPQTPSFKFNPNPQFRRPKSEIAVPPRLCVELHRKNRLAIAALT
jgi:hypothetical protein